MKELGNTKQEILQAALTLFSTQGFEAITVSQIASAVGIKKASLYSHFSSKQEILDEIASKVLDQYAKHSFFARADWSDLNFREIMKNLTSSEIENTIFNQINYILHDQMIVKSRKMLTIEQFRNKQMAHLQTKQNYTDVLNFFNGLISFCIEQKKLKDCGAKIMAAQLCLPITTWINLCDREPEKEEEILGLIAEHIRQFFKIYSI